MKAFFLQMTSEVGSSSPKSLPTSPKRPSAPDLDSDSSPEKLPKSPVEEEEEVAPSRRQRRILDSDDEESSSAAAAADLFDSPSPQRPNARTMLSDDEDLPPPVRPVPDLFDSPDSQGGEQVDDLKVVQEEKSRSPENAGHKARRSLFGPSSPRRSSSRSRSRSPSPLDKKKISKSKTPKKKGLKKAEKEAVHRETQRLKRSAPVKLPYHVPAPRTLDNFFKKIAAKEQVAESASSGPKLSSDSGDVILLDEEDDDDLVKDKKKTSSAKKGVTSTDLKKTLWDKIMKQRKEKVEKQEEVVQEARNDEEEEEEEEDPDYETESEPESEPELVEDRPKDRNEFVDSEAEVSEEEEEGRDVQDNESEKSFITPENSDEEDSSDDEPEKDVAQEDEAPKPVEEEEPAAEEDVAQDAPVVQRGNMTLDLFDSQDSCAGLDLTLGQQPSKTLDNKDKDNSFVGLLDTQPMEDDPVQESQFQAPSSFVGFMDTQPMNLEDLVVQEKPVEEENDVEGLNDADVEDDDDDPIVQKVSKKKRKKRLLVDSDEEVDDEEEEPDDEDDEDVQEDEDREVVIGPRPFAGFNLEGTKGLLKDDFVEKEAELSGSEVGSDEEEIDSDDEEAIEGLLADREVQLKSSEEAQIVRAHQEELAAEDERRVLLLKERLFEDGDLHAEGGGRKRVFRWGAAALNAHIESELKNDSDEEEGGGTGVDVQQEDVWRRERHEREKFIAAERKTALMRNAEDDLAVAAEDSQFLLKGMKAISRMNSCQDSQASNSSVTNNNAAVSRGSFLKCDEKTLNRIAELVKVADPEVAAKRADSRKFVFCKKKTPEEAKVKKRAPMRPKGDSPAKKKVTRVFKDLDDASKDGSIFKFL